MSTRLEGILRDVYGVEPLNTPREAVIWAYEALVQQIGEDDAAAELKALNDLRVKHGKPFIYLN